MITASAVGRIAIATRISSDPFGRRMGVERQLELCLGLARRLELTGNYVLYEDNDVSASSGVNRPRYQALLAALDAGKHDTVIVWHPDRLHRRPLELERFIEIIERHNVRVCTVEAGDLDLSTPTGRMIARTAVAMARHEVEHTAARHRAALRQKALDGKLITSNNRHFGYGRTAIATRGPRKGKQVFLDLTRINPVEAALIRDAAARLIAGEAPMRIVDEWTTNGVPTVKNKRWHLSTFTSIITSPSLAGLVIYQGEVLEGAKSVRRPILDMATHLAVRKVFVTRHDTYVLKHPPIQLCTRIALCGICDRPMHNRKEKHPRAGTIRTYARYTCPSVHRSKLSISCPYLDETVRREILKALWARRDDPAPTLLDPNLRVAEFEIVLARIAKREQLLADCTVAGTLTETLAADIRHTIDQDRHRVARSLGRIRDTKSDDTDTNAAIWNTLFAHFDDTDDLRRQATLAHRFDDLPMDHKRWLIHSMLRITVGRGRSPARVTITDAGR